MVTCTYNLSTWEVKVTGQRVQNQPGLYRQLKANRTIYKTLLHKKQILSCSMEGDQGDSEFLTEGSTYEDT